MRTLSRRQERERKKSDRRVKQPKQVQNLRKTYVSRAGLVFIAPSCLHFDKVNARVNASRDTLEFERHLFFVLD